SLLSFKSAIEAFAIQNKIEEFVIKTRLKTGLKSGGGITFKIETLFQLSEVPVVFLSPKTLTTFSQKSNLAGLPSTLKAYQHESYRAGAWRLSKAT
ncbi:MAG: DUF3010 family protein, partial [Rhodospirillales bacterium]|nr:DUF3010 family protein [Rhodospirillales bacterium]